MGSVSVSGTETGPVSVSVTEIGSVSVSGTETGSVSVSESEVLVTKPNPIRFQPVLGPTNRKRSYFGPVNRN